MDVKSVAAIIFVAVTVGAVDSSSPSPWARRGALTRWVARSQAASRRRSASRPSQALVLALLAAVVIARSGLALDTWAPAASWLIWVVVAFAAVSLVLNSITLQHSREARLGARRNNDAGLKFGRSTHCVIGRASHSASRWRFQQTPCLACYARSDSCTAERRS